MWGFIVALVSGALMSIQGVFNTEVTKQTSLWVSTGWVQLSALPSVCLHGFLQAEKVLLHCGRWKINIRCWAELSELYHSYCDSEYGCSGTGKGSHADRCLPASCGLCDRAFWTFRCGKGCV